MEQTVWERLQVPGIVPLLERLNADLENLTRTLQRRQAAQPMQTVQPRVKVPPTIIGAMVELPLTLPVVLRGTSADQVQDAFVRYRQDFIVAIPPGTTNVQTFPVYGHPMTMLTSPEITCDFYSPDILVQLFVDGVPVAGLYGSGGMPLTGPKGGQPGENVVSYGIAKVDTQIVTTNGTDTLIHINYAATVAYMEPYFYKETYLPLVDQLGFNSLRRLLGR